MTDDHPNFACDLHLHRARPSYSTQLQLRAKWCRWGLHSRARVTRCASHGRQSPPVAPPPWDRLLRAAQAQGLPLNFHPDDLTDAKLQLLLQLIDTTFLDGLLDSSAASSATTPPPAPRPRAARRPLRCTAVPSYAGFVSGQAAGQAGCSSSSGGGGGGGGAAAADPTTPPSNTVCAGFVPATNQIVVFRDAWVHRPALGAAVTTDGCRCSSRLEWLAHAVAHELTHVLVSAGLDFGHPLTAQARGTPQCPPRPGRAGSRLGCA